MRKRRRATGTPRKCPTYRRRVPRRFGAEVEGTRFRADPTEIQSIGIPTDLYGDVRIGSAMTVVATGFHQELQLLGIQLEQAVGV